jgi:hypothetical protein
MTLHDTMRRSHGWNSILALQCKGPCYALLLFATLGLRPALAKRLHLDTYGRTVPPRSERRPPRETLTQEPKR